LLTGALAADLAVNGLVTGLFYGLMAIGLALIFGVLRIVNFAHGEFYMVGAYAYTIVAARLGVPLVLALPIAFLFGAALGWVVERTLMRPLYANIGSWSSRSPYRYYSSISSTRRSARTRSVRRRLSTQAASSSVRR
jgi:hypothetical protein